MATSPLRRFAITGLAAISALASLALTNPSGTQYVNRNERVTLAIGCDQGADGTTCTTTQYFLSRNAGTNNVGSTFGFTPIGYANGGVSTTFGHGSDLRPTYVLRGGSTIKGQVTIGGFAPAAVAADATVQITLTGQSGNNPYVLIGSQAISKPVVAGTSDVYAFEFVVPANLDKVTVSALTAELKISSVNALTWGFVNGRGGSYFDLPYYEVVTSQ